MKYKCPVCKSLLRYERIDDGIIIREIKENYSVEEITNNSNGSTSVYCTKDNTHKIPLELIDAVIEYIELDPL